MSAILLQVVTGSDHLRREPHDFSGTEEVDASRIDQQVYDDTEG